MPSRPARLFPRTITAPFAFLSLALLSCYSQQQSSRLMTKQDLTLLDVCLASRANSRGNPLADASPKEVMLTDTVQVFPVVQIAVGARKQDTIYLANTLRLGRVGPASPFNPGWPLSGKVSIWSKLKNELEIRWFEVRPVKPCFRRNRAVRYHLQPLAARGWYHEFSGRLGALRLVVRVKYGSQVITSGVINSEGSVAEIPQISFRQDSTNVGWMTTMLNGVPYREVSSTEQTWNRLSCDSRGLAIYGLAHTGYELRCEDPTRKLDSVGEQIFKGYIRLGRLYNEKGRPARITLRRNLRRGDIIQFLTLGSYGVVYEDHDVSGYSYGGIPARLPIIRAAQGYPEVRPLSTVLWSLRTLFGKSWIKVVRYAPADSRRQRPSTRDHKRTRR